MAASVRAGLSLASTTQSDPSTSQYSSSSSTWRSSHRLTHVLTNRKRATGSSSSSSRLVLFAVLIDAQPKAKPSPTPSLITSTAEEFYVNSEVPDTLLHSEVLPLPQEKLGLTDTDLKSRLSHRMWVAFGASAVASMVAKGVLACSSSEDSLQVGGAILSAWLLADLATGFYHWGIDNYGDATTPVFGAQIDAFQGHHQRPWTITKREFANNIHAIAKPAGLFLAPFLLLPSQPFFDAFLAVFLAMVVMSQHIHSLAHRKKSQLSKTVLTLQDAGILLGRKMHGTHHKPPYDVNYCIVSGIWNPWLNETEVFKKLERWIYRKWAVAPRAWSETSEEWMQTDTYFEDGTEFDPSQSS